MNKRTKAAARERFAPAHIAALGHAERAYHLLRDSPWPGSAFASAQRHIAMATAIRLAARYGVDVTAPFEADDETGPETGPTLPLSALDAGAHPSVTPEAAQAVSGAVEDYDTLRDEYLRAVAERDRYAAVVARLRRRVGEALADAGATCTCGHTSGAHAIHKPHPCMADDDGDSGMTCPCFGFIPEGS